jgi:hypothetical protein
MTKEMVVFMAGAIFGFVIGVVGCLDGTRAARAASDGWLWGWEVKVGKRIICRDPWVWNAIKEIECDR